MMKNKMTKQPKNLEELIEKLTSDISGSEKPYLLNLLRTVARATLEVTRVNKAKREKRNWEKDGLSSGSNMSAYYTDGEINAYVEGFNANNAKREQKEKEFMGEGIRICGYLDCDGRVIRHKEGEMCEKCGWGWGGSK